MIRSIYVKSLLTPDENKHSSKRKTEELKPEKSDAQKLRKKGHDKIDSFLAGCYTFEKALEYDDVSRDDVENKEVELYVCVTQKYTRKSFAVARCSMKMKDAARKIVKERLYLKAMPSTELPEHMKVYSTCQKNIQLQVNGALQRSASSASSCASWATPFGGSMSTSPSDLVSIKSESTASRQSYTVELPEEKEFVPGLEGVTISKPRSGRSDEFVCPMGDVDEEQVSVSVRKPVSSVEVDVHVPRLQDHERIGGTTHLLHVPIENESDSSRPETPSWDYYTETPLFEQERAEDAAQGWSGESCLPVASTMQLDSTSRKNRRLPLDV